MSMRVCRRAHTVQLDCHSGNSSSVHWRLSQHCARVTSCNPVHFQQTHALLANNQLRSKTTKPKSIAALRIRIRTYVMLTLYWLKNDRFEGSSNIYTSLCTTVLVTFIRLTVDYKRTWWRWCYAHIHHTYSFNTERVSRKPLITGEDIKITQCPVIRSETFLIQCAHKSNVTKYDR